MSLDKGVVVSARARVLAPVGALEPEIMVTIFLANLEVTFAGDEADLFVAVQADRAYEMDRLTGRACLLQSVDNISLAGLEEFVSRLFIFKLVLPLEVGTKEAQRRADLDIHHIGCGELRCQFVCQRGHLASVWSLVAGEKLLHRACRGYCLLSHSGRGRGKAKQTLKLSKIHSSHLIESIAVMKLPLCVSLSQAPGVVSDLAALEGTGGGSLAQDISEIEFLQ